MRTVSPRPAVGRRICLAVMATLLVASGLAPLAVSPASAQSAGDVLPPPTFPDAQLTLTDRPAPISYLGVGDGLAHVSQSDAATAVGAYGFDPGRADTSGFAEHLPYEDGWSFGEDVLDAAVVSHDADEDASTSTEVVAIHRPANGGAWRATLVGEQRAGFRSARASWTFGAGTASVDAVPGQPVGVEMLWLPQLEDPLVVFATTEGLFLYEVGDDVELVDTIEVGGELLDAEPAAIDHDPGLDLGPLTARPDLTNYDAPVAPGDAVRVVVATRTDGPAAATDRVDELLFVDLAQVDLATDDPWVPSLILRASDDVPEDALVFSAGDTVQVAYSAIAEGPETLYYGIGVQAGEQWRRFTLLGFGSIGLDDEAVEIDLDLDPESYPCASPHDGRPGFDYLAVGFITGGYMHGINEAGVCVANTGADGLQVDAHRWSPRGDQQVTRRMLPRGVNGIDRFVQDPQALLTLPCAELLRINEVDSLRNSEDPDATCDDPANDGPQRVFGLDVLAGISSVGGTSRAEVDQTRLYGASPFAPSSAGAEGEWDQFWHVDLPAAGLGGTVRSLVRLPNTPVEMTVVLDDDGCVIGDDGGEAPPVPSSCTPRISVGDPIPMAILAAPPTVAGADQNAFGAPTFASSSGTGSGETDLSASRIGAMVGYEVATPLFGGGVEIQYEREVSEEVTTSVETTQTEAFGGLMDDDVLVYNATTMWALDATVVESSIGVGLGSTVELLHPRSSVLTSSSMSFAQQAFPDTLGPSTPLGKGLDDALRHTVGDPGSYFSYFGGGNVDNYCEGSIDGTEPIEVPDSAGVAPNPFVNDPPPPSPDNAVLVSAPHVVLAGTANAEGAVVEIVESDEQTYMETHSIDVSVTGRAFGVAAGVSAGGTFGSGWQYSVSEGTSFEASVGHIPHETLGDETYEWRMFLCKRDISTGGLDKLPVWVLNYTVDGYVGVGDYELGPVTAVSPVGSSQVEATDVALRWQQDDGVVASFDWELEAIGVDDDRSGSIRYDEREDGRDPGVVTAEDLGGPLVPGATYRWRVTTTDVLGKQVRSDYQFFEPVAPAAPSAAFSWSPPAPTVGEAVTFTVDQPDPDASYTWDVDGDTASGTSITRTFSDGGQVPVRLDATGPGGEATDVRSVPVRALAADDLFTLDEDVELSVDAPGVLANDDGADRALVDGTTTRGDLRLAATGAFSYRPDPDVCGVDGFGYTASGGEVEGRTGTVALQVACVNDAPDARADEAVGTEDQLLQVSAPGVLANDTDADEPHHQVDDGHLTATVHEPAGHGEVTLAPTGAWTYAPDLDFCGTDAFTYAAHDGTEASEPATVQVEVECANDLPPADAEPVQVDVTPGEPAVVDLAPDTEQVAITEITDPALGTVQVDGSTVTYLPRSGECGPDEVIATLTGPDGDTVEVAVEVRVACEGVVDPALLRYLGGPAAIEDGVVAAASQQTGRDGVRLAGADRYETSARVARDAWPDGAETVLVATGGAFPDGLAAGAAAVRFDAPVVLTRPDGLDEATRDVLVDLAPDQVIVLGGESAVGQSVVDAITRATGARTRRIGGADRYETSANIADTGWPDGADTVYVATGTVFPDAMAGAAAAGVQDAPVVLSRPDDLPDVTARALRRLQPSRVVLLGGSSALSGRVESAISRASGVAPHRIAGADRYATATAIARDAWPDGARSSYLATGVDFPDALSGAAAAGRRRVPVLLVRPTVMPDSTAATLRRLLQAWSERP